MVKIVVYISQTYLTKLPILHLSPCSPLVKLQMTRNCSWSNEHGDNQIQQYLFLHN